MVRGGILERYIGPDQEVLIPEGIVRIGERAFAGSDIESVRFPASVTYIAAYAFADCPLLTRLEFCSLPHLKTSLLIQSDVRKTSELSGVFLYPCTNFGLQSHISTLEIYKTLLS